MKSDISIVITTYNRRHQLDRLLKSIANLSLSDYEEVLIIDNKSDYDIKELISQYKRLNIRLITNRVNIGMSTNVITPFIHAKTKWIWTLSDDDVVLNSAMGDIHESISSTSEDTCLIKFSIEGHYCNKNQEIESLSMLVDYFYKDKGKLRSGDLIFISNSVYNIDNMREYCHFGFTYSYTNIGFLIPALKMLDSGLAKVVFSEKNIVQYMPPEGDGYSFEKVALGLSTITDIPFNVNIKTRKRLNILFMPITYRWFVANFFLNDRIDKWTFKKLCRNIYLPNLPFKDGLLIFVFTWYLFLFNDKLNPAFRYLRKKFRTNFRK